MRGSPRREPRSRVFAAAEGQELDLGRPCEEGASIAPDRTSALIAAVPATARTVLLALDDPERALHLTALLRKDGLRLVEVTELAAALDAARLAPPSLVLLDLKVPRGELLAACRELRSSSDPRLRDVPLLLVQHHLFLFRGPDNPLQADRRGVPGLRTGDSTDP